MREYGCLESPSFRRKNVRLELALGKKVINEGKPALTNTP